MDALMSSAQSWVPWVGVAGLILCKSWVKGLAVTGPRAISPSAIATFFICLGLGAIVPVAACVLAWTLHGGIAFLGPLGVLLEPASDAHQKLVLAWLAAPPAIYLVTRYVFNSADAIAFAIAGAAAITFSGTLGGPAALALALASGALAAIATRLSGEAATGLAAIAAFAHIFAFTYAGGGQPVALITLAVIGGYVLALIAAGGGRARLPLFLVMPIAPALALAYLDGAASGFDLSRALPPPAIGNSGGLILMLALVPAILAPLAWLPMLIARASSRREGLLRLALEPVAIGLELALGLALFAGAALALSAGGALYSQLHELGGGERLLRVETILRQIRPAPFAPAQWWIIAPLLLPLAPCAAHALIFLTRLWLRLIDASGLGPWLEDATGGGPALQRLALTLVRRVVQLVPGVIAIWLALDIAAPLSVGLKEQLRPVASQLFDACAEIAHAIDGWGIH